MYILIRSALTSDSSGCCFIAVMIISIASSLILKSELKNVSNVTSSKQLQGLFLAGQSEVDQISLFSTGLV